MTKRNLRRIATAITASAAVIALAACSSGADGGDELETIRVGALPVPAGDMLQFVDENLAEEAGLSIEYVEFNDYNTPNPALTDGSTEANLFQNTDFMDTYNEQAGGDLVSIGDVYLPAAAFHSREYTSFDDLPDGATIAVPNDPTNEGRALKMLAAAGLIEATDDMHNLDGVTSNPRGFEFLEVENATLPLALDDADVAFVTAAFAIPAGLTAETAILTETEDSDYYNALVTTSDLADDPALQTLFELLTSQETADFINENWEGLIIPATGE
ncbi:MAG TPA: MetQ/NlpA family ABC transporter substrate-binding protein [Candidatus Agrococcus pullicola]|uniref:MetQ/NlpA family ABC transporter substrate-binding protein n=1 Tax=Candidatus Agrococcus pullicola TaxID=2838429 RepID=A0A9D1YWW1_9MICO|nr:MetQ/NlpA family ABC transporter substrate-binding protein [Candidatus Agrococcus pullicola]